MVCSACSRSFDGTARFCSVCGQPLVPPVQTQFQQAPLMRPRYGRMIAGVCAGFANAYRWDSALVRIIVCVAALCSAGTILLAYIVAWIVMPEVPYVVVPVQSFEQQV